MKRGREIFSKAKPILRFLAKIVSIAPIRVRKNILTFFRDTKGYKGLGIRYILLKSITKECGDNVSIHPGVYLLNAEGLKIGNNVSIHPMCYLDACGGIEIGNDVSIAHGVSVLSFEHLFSNKEVCIKDQGISLRKVVIENNVWVGAKATITGGKRIGTGSIIGAGSIITHDVPKYVVVAGVPAKIIKNRAE